MTPAIEKLREALSREIADWVHGENCSRLMECDERDPGEECSEHQPDPCPECECGKGAIQAILDAHPAAAPVPCVECERRAGDESDAECWSVADLREWVHGSRAKAESENAIFDTLMLCVTEGNTRFVLDPEELVDALDWADGEAGAARKEALEEAVTKLRAIDPCACAEPNPNCQPEDRAPDYCRGYEDALIDGAKEIRALSGSEPAASVAWQSAVSDAAHLQERDAKVRREALEEAARDREALLDLLHATLPYLEALLPGAATTLADVRRALGSEDKNT